MHIGADAWHGANVTVPLGVIIGEGAVVEAEVVAMRDTLVCAGVGVVPAKVIKEF